jgi:iron-sulfur cluster assembly protein
MSDVMQYSSAAATGVSFSEAAKRRLLSYLAEKGESNHVIRLSVKKTGCSGMAYVIDYVEKAQEEDIVFPFVDDYLVCVARSSFPYLKGIHIDYVKQGLNQKFVFNNPNQTGQCGCGESFTVD